MVFCKKVSIISYVKASIDNNFFLQNIFRVKSKIYMVVYANIHFFYTIEAIEGSSIVFGTIYFQVFNIN